MSSWHDKKSGPFQLRFHLIIIIELRAISCEHDVVTLAEDHNCVEISHFMHEEIVKMDYGWN